MSELFKALSDLHATLCDPEGTVCIAGSDGDRAVIQSALSKLEGMIAVTVGDGLSVYGTSEAIHRAQNYILLDSTHPVEKEDVRRSLARDLQAAEAKIETMRTALVRARDQFRFYAEQHRAKGTEDGDTKAITNDAMAATCDEPLQHTEANPLCSCSYCKLRTLKQ